MEKRKAFSILKIEVDMRLPCIMQAKKDGFMDNGHQFCVKGEHYTMTDISNSYRYTEFTVMTMDRFPGIRTTHVMDYAFLTEHFHFSV